MDETTLGEKIRKTAEDVAQRMGELAQMTGEKIGDMRESQKLSARIRDLEREKERCKIAIADLVIRMFDQGAFIDNLLRPEYTRIKEIDAEIARLEKEREEVGQHEEVEKAPTEGTTP